MTSDSVSRSLSHPDGTTVLLDARGVQWTEPDGRKWRDEYQGWTSSAYAARLIKIGFRRER